VTLRDSGGHSKRLGACVLEAYEVCHLLPCMARFRPHRSTLTSRFCGRAPICPRLQVIFAAGHSSTHREGPFTPARTAPTHELPSAFEVALSVLGAQLETPRPRDT
jgi:hypothetical protein